MPPVMPSRYQPDIWNNGALSADCCTIACWVIIVTRAVGDVFMRAVSAARNMYAKRGRAVTLDGAHHLHLIEVDVDLPLPFLRLSRFRLSSGLNTAVSIPVATLV